MKGNSDTENVLSKRLNNVLQTHLENDNDTLMALKQLSTFYTENTIQARRNLRSQIEKRSLEINKSFLNAFKDVKDSFDLVYNDISEMKESMQVMSNRLQNAKSQTKDLLDQTNSLQSEARINEVQSEVLQLILERFQLNKSELEALHGNRMRKDTDITLEIFTVLDKVQQIRDNCKALLQSGNQILALDIMDQLTLHQEGAMERIFRWTQSHGRNIDRPEYTEIITHAMARLQERPLLFKGVIDEYCVSRRAVLVGDFIDALTRGGPAGNPAPIELRVHDPQIYVTDMLVWMNKAIPVEKQQLSLFVSRCNQDELGTIADDALRSICEGICHPFRVRIEKIIGGDNDASTLYAITNLLRYYKKMIGKITSGGELGTSLFDLEAKCESFFLQSLEKRVNNALVKVEAPPRDLSPTSSINCLLILLRDMLSTSSMSEGRESDMIKIAKSIADPLLRAINEQAARLPPTDMAVYLLNCMYAMYTCLSMYQYMDSMLERIQAQSDAQLDTLTSEQASALLANLQLGAVYTILQECSSGAASAPLSGIPGMEPTTLKNFMIKFDAAVAKPDSLLLQQVHLLASSQHKKSIQKRAFLVLLAIYKQLYEAVHNPINLYENPENILSILPDTLATMIN